MAARDDTMSNSPMIRDSTGPQRWLTDSKNILSNTVVSNNLFQMPGEIQNAFDAPPHVFHPKTIRNTPLTSPRGSRASSPECKPFNFEPKVLRTSPARPSHRRGHRYKQSSVSIQFFQEPTQRAPLTVPISLAIPTFYECWKSMSRPQAAQLGWCILRIAMSVFIFSQTKNGAESVAILTYLLGYDGVASLANTSVNLLSNFDAWKQCSLRLPFALQRLSVLLDFALSITLTFLGCDTLSHTIQHAASNWYGGHVSAHAHSSNIPVIPVIAALAVALLSTVNTSYSNTDMWASLQVAPITAVYAVAILTVSQLPATVEANMDQILCIAIALTVIWRGWDASKQNGCMLVMSYTGPDYTREIKAALLKEPLIESVEDVSIWRVHRELWLGTVKIQARGTDENQQRLRYKASEIMSTIIGIEPNQWESTIDIVRNA